MVVLVIPFLVRLLKKAKWHIIVLLRERPLGDNVGPNTFLEDQKPTAVKTNFGEHKPKQPYNSSSFCQYVWLT